MACMVFQLECLDQFAELDLKVKSHLAWRDGLSKKEIESYLYPSSVYSYFLTQGEVEGMYTLSFLHPDETVHYHVIRIVQDQDGNMKYRNGTIRLFDEVESVIPYSMGCTEGACCPCDSK